MGDDSILPYTQVLYSLETCISTRVRDTAVQWREKDDDEDFTRQDNNHAEDEIPQYFKVTK